MEKNARIYIAGHKGMVGSAIHRKLKSEGYENIVTRTLEELDLTNQQAVIEFFKKEKPDYVILAAAKVGGIVANNTYRADFIYENIQIQNNIIHQSYVYGVKKLLFLGSSCIYPKNAPQPLKEEYLLNSELEYTNEPYAIAKIAGLKMCESYNIQYNTNFIAVMPTNLYGPNDNYDLEKSHVLPALIRKMHLGKCLQNNDWKAIRNDLNKNPIEKVDGNASEEAIIEILNKYGIHNLQPATCNSISISLWGTGSPFREFLYVEDLAEACVYLLQNINFNDLVKVSTSNSLLTTNDSGLSTSNILNTHINIGTGKDLTIKELAEIVKEIVGFKGGINWDTTKPDGTVRKLMDVSKINALGWKEKIVLNEGIIRVYKKYTE